ncbi:MAG: hypothetical protein AAGH83_03175 [Pseudomonadota bacterium]
MRSILAGLCLVTLTACGTQTEQCIRGQTQELRTINRLVGETEANIARGYRYETELRNSSVSVGFCTGYPRSYGYWGFCGNNYPRTVRRAVPIDPDIEARTLAGLKAKQAELRRTAAPAIEACQARYGPLPPAPALNQPQ